MKSYRLWFCLIAVFLSGASALTYEILWQRQMFLIFGASAPATTAILTAIFVGIAFGSLLAIPLLRLTSQTLILFAAIEAMIGIWGLLVPTVLEESEKVYRLAAAVTGEQHPALDLIRFLLAVCSVLPATLCMGATIPVMVRALSDQQTARVSMVYGINILGAVAGGLATGLIWIRWLGMSDTRLTAVAMNAVAVLILLTVARRRLPGTVIESTGDLVKPEPASASASDEVIPFTRPRGLALMYFFSGFIALGLEVVWLRLLGIINTNSTVTFSLSLSVYLLGMGLGSLLLFPLLNRFLKPIAIFSLGNGAIALTSLLTFAVIYAAPSINHRIIAMRVSEGRLTLTDIYRTEAMIIGMLMLLPTIFMGLIYPSVCGSASGSGRQRDAWIASTYFLGTLGSVAGILSVSLLLIPRLGLHAAFSIQVILSSLICTLSWMQFQQTRSRWIIPAFSALLIVGAAAVTIDARPVLRETKAVRQGETWLEYSVGSRPQPTSELIRFKAGKSATVIIKQEIETDDRLVYVDDQLVASTNMGARVDALMLAHLPLLLHPHPLNELTVGFGSGGTSFAITTHNVDAYCVEIEAEVPRSAFLLTGQNFDILSNPRFKLIINDARDHLGIGRRHYDVIATDVTNLQYKQNSFLYTVEYFELMKQRLQADGIACAWIPMAAISTRELRILMKSFQHVFPHATLWYMNHTHTNFGILIGTPQPLEIDYARLSQGFALPAVAENMKLIGMNEPLQLVHCLHLDEHGYRSFCGQVPLHTDNDPVLEFSSPLSFYQYHQTFRDNLFATLALRPTDFRPYVTNGSTESNSNWQKHQEASIRFCLAIQECYDFIVARNRMDLEAAMAHLKEAVDQARLGMQAWPEDDARAAFYESFFAEANDWLQSALQ